MKYDLEERVSNFGESVIKTIKLIKISSLNENCIKQLLKSSTSIGANYMEANHASSKKDFSNKIYLSRKEANETKYWLRMLATTEPDLKTTCLELWKEAHELTLILVSISQKIKNK